MIDYELNDMNKKILMVAYSYYPSDTRIRKEAETLLKNGFEVDILCLRKENEPSDEIFNNVKIFRVNLQKKREGMLTYIYLYTLFFVLVFFKLNYLFLKKKYTFFHFHNMPNFLVFSAIFGKLFRRKIILDIHDPMPELLNSVIKKFNKIIKRILFIEEKLSVKFADAIITTNKAFKELFIDRGCPANKIEIVMNSPQTSIFKENIIFKRNDNKFIILYNGTIVERHGLDLLVDTINELKCKIPGLELKIFGTGEFWNVVQNKIDKLGVQDYVKYYGGVIIDDLIYHIATCDLGVIPNRFNEFTNLNFPIRIFEYIHFKKPLIVPKTKGIMDYFSDDSIFYFNPSDHKSLSSLIFFIYENMNNIKSLIEKAYGVYQKNNWKKQEENLIKIYSKLSRYYI